LRTENKELPALEPGAMTYMNVQARTTAVQTAVVSLFFTDKRSKAT
jgi:hypothetical protein